MRRAKEALKVGSPTSVVVATVLMVVFTVIANLARKSMYTAFGTHYTFFRQELTNLMYDIWATIVLLIGLKVSPANFKLSKKKLTLWSTAGDAFPLLYLVGLAFCDGGADFMQSVSGTYTPGPWMVLLGQTQIFFIMVFAFIILRQKFHWIQVLGATAAVVGTCMAIFPIMSGCNESSTCRWYSVMIFGLGNIPACLSVILKERAFKSAGLNVFFLTSVVSWTQVAVTWVFLPLQQFQGFGGIPWSEIPATFRDGFLCFIGDSSIPVYNNGELVGYCNGYTTGITFLFSLTGFVQGVLQLSVVKYGSASASVIALAVGVPLSDLLFSWRAIAGSSYTPVNVYNIIGLVIVIAGFLAYNFRDLLGLAKSDADTDVESVAPLLEHPDAIASAITLPQSTSDVA